MKLSKNEIVAEINNIYDAVNSSKVGPIKKENELGKEEMQTLGYQTYCIALTALLPRDVWPKEMIEAMSKKEK